MLPWRIAWKVEVSRVARFHAAVLLLLLAAFAAPGARAADGTSQLRAVVGAGVSQGTALGGPWAPRTSYSASLWGLWEAGQGVGARLSLLPPATSAGAWALSTDAVARFTGEGPLYFKALGGAAVTARPWGPLRVRAGTEAGVHAIRGSIGLEVGVAGVYAFPPSHFAQGQAVVSVGVGVLFGFTAPSRAHALAPPQRQWAQQSPQSPAGAFPQQSSGFPASTELAQGPLPPSGERDVIQQILLLQKPGPVQDWWNSGPAQDLEHWSHPLSEWELKYLEAMSADSVPEALSLRPRVTPERLTPEQREDMKQQLGTSDAAAEGYAHWVNRRRIVTHYVMTHPATLRPLMALYGLARDANPLHFALERGWQMGGGQEMFTGQEVSKLGAAQEFFAALAVGVATGKLMTATRPVRGWGAPQWGEPVSPGQVKAPPAPPRAVELVPEPPAAPAPEPAPAPAPLPTAPGLLAPSPELVLALTSKNPTPQVTASPRLQQDVNVKPKVPDLRKLDRPIGLSLRQNAQIQRDITYLKDELGAENIRVNQQQLTVNEGQRAGINRPDLQFDYNDRRYYVEYDSPTSGRGTGHQSRLTANHPEAEVILIIIPEQ